MILVHGTGVFIDGKGVLIKGMSRAGKSDLALRLMAPNTSPPKQALKLASKQ